MFYSILSPVTLKRIDLTGNLISEIQDGAFSKLTLLEELNLAENHLVKLPMLPGKLTTFNANHNQLKTKGVKANAFKVCFSVIYSHVVY
jgi:osteoglycin (osteoinductive factor mimecan)